MNFLKISGSVLGTGSVVGGAGAGIYYGLSKNVREEKIEKGNEKTQFVRKLVFEKKTGKDNYEIKFFDNDQYNNKLISFDKGKNENEKYEAVNKVVEISLELNLSEVTKELNAILDDSLTLLGIKEKITEKETEIKRLFNNDIYENLKTKFNS